MSARPGSAPMSAVSLASTRASRRVRSIVSTRCAVKVVQRVSRVPSAAIDDVGDVAVDHIAGVEHDRADRGALGQPLERFGVGLSVGGSSASSASVVPSSGVGTSALPSSSSTTAASASSPPAPPSSSGTTSAAAPTCSHNSFHSDSS